MNILVRADSSSSIGTGHIMRDLVLAKQFSNDNIIFATQDLDGNINQKVKEENYRVKLLESNDFEELNELIKKLSIDLLIIDHYKIGYKFEKKLKKENKSLKILSFDDTYEKHYCDILLNHNIYANTKKYKKKVPKNCELRCGLEYTLLREEFLKIKNQKIEKTKTIFLAMGGADHKNLNIKVLKTIQKNLQSSFRVNIVTTNANKNLEKLKNYCENKSWINLQINSNEVGKLMYESSFAIVTPSVTVNEIYYLDIPFIAIKTAKNQNEMYKYLIKNNYYVLKEFDNKKLKKYLEIFGEKYENR
ncbi:UDP-2,4-diacetamido-2,4,6-trideoxy-beta-L-altropyranose hydrolase [Aliarcobacter lanthieri]|uniref:UDP-2,4-diacetamido-2,4, 6-trideoxy-beta-L-altropyranose hydrolase n=1 Tax=Aliarcobacter lanthieri TaxID=1355374 RepID=UPI000479A0A7|nr:UDP-2,4-diacetamido-2,4,6-trideoxy-beta-L-altropyranose hydrolase [Aliarcobacter lanthieri]QKF60197.1 UDP-2,4-diacetamido-2,4,6-trideoxy-beta-L-altropyranosyl transferase [Aliarcobacter lanthieri]